MYNNIGKMITKLKCSLYKLDTIYKKNVSSNFVTSAIFNMDSTLDVIISIVIITVIGVQTQTLVPGAVSSVVHTSGMLNFIQLPENSNEFSSSCQLKIPSDSSEITIDLQEYLINPYKLKSGENIKKTSSDLCGVRMYPISIALDDSTFELIVLHNNGTPVYIPFSISVKKKFDNVSPVNISQSNTDTYFLPYESLYHEYEDEFGTLFEGKVNKEFYSFNSDKWIGRGLVRFQMEEIKTIYNLIEGTRAPTVKKQTELTSIDTAESLIFKCDSALYNDVCYARKPDGSMINLGTGLTSEKYTSYDTQVAKGLCSIEILKPIDEIDKGIWKIVFPQKPTGCIFSIEGEKDKTKQIENILATANSPIQLDADVTPSDINTVTKMTIKCEYPDEIEHCVLHNPYGVIEIEDSFLMAQTIVMGYCSYKVDPIPGDWMCSIKTKDSEILKTIHYRMNTYNSSYLTTSNEMSEQRFKTESIQIMCQIRFSHQLEYCLFESPSGLWYGLSEKTRNVINRISYAGQGLRYGDCGIEITNIQQEDFGNWTCYVKANSLPMTNRYHSIKINLLESEIVSSAVVLGVSIACGIILLTAISWYTYTKYRSKRTVNNASDTEI